MKKKKEINPKLKVGDRIVCYHMDGEYARVPPYTEGTVTKIQRDPFEPNENDLIISVDWDNGSKLALVSATDSWILSKNQIGEAKTNTLSNEYNFFADNPEIFENFDWKFLRDYLSKVRKASPVNMFQSGPFLYSGKKWIDRYYGEDLEDNEDFQDVLSNAEEAKDKMVHGTIKWMESQGMEIELDAVNRTIGRLATKIVQLYMTFY
jgi:hypothetical protein